MSKDTLTINEIANGALPLKADLAWTTFDYNNGAQFENDGHTILLVANGHSAPQSITVESVADPRGREGDMTVATTNAKQSAAGPFPKTLWNQSDGYIYISGSSTTSLTLAAVRLPRA